MNDYIINTISTLDGFIHDCTEHLELRERKVGNGTAYVEQCLFCGQQRGQSIGKKKIPIAPPAYDFELEGIHNKKYMELLTKDSVIEPAGRAFDLFKREMDDFLTDYGETHSCKDMNGMMRIYLNRTRDEYINAYKSEWRDEDHIKEWFETEFSNWFFIDKEVEGKGYVNRKQRRLRIDFVLRAKPVLLDAGFTSQPIGVEAKFLDPRVNRGFTGKASHGVFQALSYWYSGSQWNIPSLGKEEELACVLLLSNLSFAEDRDYIFNEIDRLHKHTWASFLNLANHANVGEIYIKRNTRHGNSWSLDFSGSTYFKLSQKGEPQLGNVNVINKERIGNSR